MSGQAGHAGQRPVPPTPYSQLQLEVPADPRFPDDILVAREVSLPEARDDPPWSDGDEDSKNGRCPKEEGRVDDEDLAAVR